MGDMKSIEDLVRCSLCLERLKSPRMLPCQHNFCVDCLGHYVASKLLEAEDNGNVVLSQTAKGSSGELRIIFKCPECDKEVHYQRLTDIEKSLKCIQILDVLEPTKQWPKCESCKNDNNVSFGCIDCDKQFCRACFEQKRCLSLSHAAGKIIDSENISCMTHGLEFRYLCSECDILICLDCFLEFHNIHPVKMVASVDTELRAKLKQCRSLANGNTGDSNELEKEIAKMKVYHHLEAMEALKEWTSIASSVRDEMANDLLHQKEDELVSKVYHIGKDLQTVCESIDDVSTEIEKFQQISPKTLRFRPKIEQILLQCNEQEMQIMNLRVEVSQLKKVTALNDWKELFLSKLGSLIDEDIKNRRKAKTIQEKNEDVNADCSHTEEHTKSSSASSPSSPGKPLEYVNYFGHLSCPASSQNPGSPATVSSAMDAGEGEPYSPIAQPSSPTSRQRRYRLHAAQSVSCPRLLNMAVGQNLKHSESAKNLYESNSSSGRKKGGKKVTIVDPKSGRDVTEEILRKGRERPKEP